MDDKILGLKLVRADGWQAVIAKSLYGHCWQMSIFDRSLNALFHFFHEQKEVLIDDATKNGFVVEKIKLK